VILPPKEIVFDGQSEQLAGPNPSLYVPGKHCVHMPVPVNPGLQMQMLMLVAPVSSEPEPTRQYEHAAEPETDLNRAAAHGAHAPLSGPVKPASHRHRSRRTPGAGDCELAEQLAHSAGPIAGLNVFTAHGAHAPPFSPVYPGLHWQDVITVLPAREVALPGQNEHASEPVAVLNVPGAHCAHRPPLALVKPALQVQLLMLVAPSSSAYEPTGQIEHAAEPVAVLNVPAAQSAHEPMPLPVKPALHRQRSRRTPNAVDCEFGRHLMQSCGPPMSLNSPTGHAMQSPVSVAKKPAAHRSHSAKDTLPAKENDGARQFLHKCGPIMSLYLPTGHSWQSVVNTSNSLIAASS